MCFKAYLFFWVFVIAIFLWNLQKDYCSALPRGTRMVIRYDKFEWVINDKFGRVDQVYISQYNGTDFANINMTADVDIVLHKMTMDMIRCKEHYIDCVNYRSFEVERFCGKEKAILFFIKMGYINRELLCTIDKGLLVIKNGTLNVDNIVEAFALALDKWWESTWKWDCVFFSRDGPYVVHLTGQLRFLLLSRQRTRRH